MVYKVNGGKHERHACTFASLSASTSTCTAACVARSSPQRCSAAAAAASASCVGHGHAYSYICVPIMLQKHANSGLHCKQLQQALCTGQCDKYLAVMPHDNIRMMTHLHPHTYTAFCACGVLLSPWADMSTTRLPRPLRGCCALRSHAGILLRFSQVPLRVHRDSPRGGLTSARAGLLRCCTRLRMVSMLGRRVMCVHSATQLASLPQVFLDICIEIFGRSADGIP